MAIGIIKNLHKDIRIEFRSRIAFNIAIAFAGIATLSISFTSAGVPFTPQVQAIILWLVIFFTAMNSLAHIFVREIEEKTDLFLSVNTDMDSIYISKLIYNIIFFIFIQIIISILYIFFLQITIYDPMLFIFILFTGGLSISSATTILGAMVAKAGGKGALFTIISFPIVLPVLWTSMKSTAQTLESSGRASYNSVVFLLAFSVIIIAVSILIFKHLWSET